MSFPTRPCPISKLSLRYGVAINTVRKALDKLISEGLLSREGRSFNQRSSASQRHQLQVVLVRQESWERGVSNADPRTEEVVKSFERESLRSGFIAQFEGFDSVSTDSLLATSESIGKRSNVAGYIVNMWNPGNVANWNRWIDLLRFITNCSRPVVVLDQEGDLEFPKELLQYRNFRVLRIPSERAGEMMAEALLRLGHRQAAFIMPSSKPSWAMSRFFGFARYFKDYGGEDAVVERHSAEHEIDQPFDLTLSALGLNERDIAALLSSRLSNEEIRRTVQRLDLPEWLKVKSLLPKGQVLDTIRAFAPVFAGMLPKNRDPHIFGYLLDSFLNISTASSMQLYRADFFKSVVEKSKATAWACCDDHTAIDAIAFLNSHGRKVPGDISVYGIRRLVGVAGARIDNLQL